MAEGIIGISASFLALTALILWLVIISKGSMWTAKSIVITLTTLFTIIVFLSLKSRTEIANTNNGDVFLSIHANSIEFGLLPVVQRRAG